MAAVEERASWLSYLTFGRLGASQENAVIPPFTPEFNGPGLHKVHDPVNAIADIVFVHGLTGSHKTCVPSARIFVWEYDADVFKKWINHHASGNRLFAHGSNVCERLAGHRARTGTQRRPLIFIGHSLGGLVIQRALLHSDESPDVLYNDIVDSTAGVIFLGTPHRGSTLANWGGLGADFAHIVKDINQAIVDLLKPSSEILFQLRDSFMKLVIKRAREPKNALRIKCYFEELGMTLIGKIVTEESAIFEGYPFGSIHADHVKMTKFARQNGLVDQGYEDILESICMMIGHAKDMQNSIEGAELVSSRQRFPLSIEGSRPVRGSLLPQKLLPSDSGNIHQPMTATAVWKMVQATSSNEFLARFQTRFVQKSFPLPTRIYSGFSSDGGQERKSAGGSVLGASQPTEMADSREIFEIAEQQSHVETPRLTSQTADQKHVATISDWLSNINHQEMHNFKSSERYHKTGVWISKDVGFQNWRDTSQSSVFWLHGSAGSGKSVLSSFVIDALSANNNVNVIYFYCQNKQFRNHVSILRSFLKQLYLRTKFSVLMDDFYHAHRNDTPCDGTEQDIRSYLELFLRMISTSRTYMILDGMDECTDDGVENLFSAWKYISRRSSRVVKLFISSRDVDCIRTRVNRELHERPYSSAALSLSLNANQVSDVESFIESQSEQVAKEWDIWQSSSQEVLQYATSMIMEQSRGSFSRVRLLFDSLKSSAGIKYTTDGANTETVPSSLEAAYSHLIRNIALKDPITASVMERTFYWLVFALEPLRAQDITFAIRLGLAKADEQQLQPLDAARISNCCKGLVVYTPPDELRFVHRSAKEFLSQRLDSSLAHVYLSKICLTALTSMARRPDAEENPHEEEKSCEEGLFAYAQRNYLIHGFKAIALDRRIGPYIDADELPGFEVAHHITIPQEQ
ncbi:hypothetical protein MMC07_003764 [Pseudocyphellaria aurata]|nr:hypothetical protein [Pseudocyphellaria aurata]